ncbi:MAG: DNA-3-methyladenine glycosylase I [Anaerolineales bacterium]|nr:DNA-3-methyladenine glycosylase I [Anaerolineales bacterium]
MTASHSAHRCFGTGDPLMEAYHDLEWGLPVHDSRALFEKLVLDSFQAGLSWRTILHKREAFRRAFHGFDPERIARYSARDRTRLLADAGIVRNRLKIDAAIGNARAYLRLEDEQGSFAEYLWGFTGGRSLRPRAARAWRQVPTHSPESDAMSKDLQAHGFRFVGPTICYAFMQAVGMVDDHLVGCFRYQQRR